MTKKMPTIDELALMQISREDHQALLARIAKKRVVIERVMKEIGEARAQRKTEARISFYRTQGDTSYQTAVSALGDMGYVVRTEEESSPWGIRELNTAYYDVAVVRLRRRRLPKGDREAPRARKSRMTSAST